MARQLSGNTFLIAGLVMVVLVLLLALPVVSSWLYRVWPLALLLSWEAWQQGTQEFATRHGRVYQALFK